MQKDERYFIKLLNIGKLLEPARNCFLQILAGIEYCNI